jgi:hypothetical protein
MGSLPLFPGSSFGYRACLQARANLACEFAVFISRKVTRASPTNQNLKKKDLPDFRKIFFVY